MDRLIAPQMQGKRKSPNFSKLRMVIPSLEMRKKSKKVGKRGSGSRFCPLERIDPNRCSRVCQSTRLAVRLSGLYRLIGVAFSRRAGCVGFP
ncbi:hypothetical protein CRG98_037265 [Punica granatum]|uniref:Uncharacterized protein n=1 Tax=Punica granatum TaxID=22663 RepID=A0A2I0IG70_PUNGR|nr:hypothetical protein CRG98_037265 [Punica granatum]